MSKLNKEQVYDTQIAPLMHDIVRICAEHDIAMLTTFAIPIPGDDGLRVTTATLDENNERPMEFEVALAVVVGTKQISGIVAEARPNAGVIAAPRSRKGA
jgi:hypothetical protein